MMSEPFIVTTHDMPNWRAVGSHLVADGSCCHCGPANHLTGPQWACDHRPGGLAG
jgi:hypothetical protein